MKFHSTRNHDRKYALSYALEHSLAEDGGLFVPESFPQFTIKSFDGLELLPDIACRWLEPFFQNDRLQEFLPEICRQTFSFPIPLKRLDDKTEVLELFHGPTCAFKDVGARFLAECLSRLTEPNAPLKTVLVATSGDTGAAVAAAFYGRPGFEVIILFPRGKVSARQEKQLTSWGQNVRAFAVQGDFDDCQRIVKAAFSDPWWKLNRSLVSANSINIGRLLPQAAYYVKASLTHWREEGVAPFLIVPSGNLGNATAALWAKKTGLPIEKVVLATNANATITNFFRTEKWAPVPTVVTLANAMDVGNPSNMERIRDLYPDFKKLKTDIDSVLATDLQITTAIKESDIKWKVEFCPHTATAAFARTNFKDFASILVATAHPAKFETIVEPLLKRPIEIPLALNKLLSQPSHVKALEPTLEALTKSCAEPLA